MMSCYQHVIIMGMLHSLNMVIMAVLDMLVFLQVLLVFLALFHN